MRQYRKRVLLPVLLLCLLLMLTQCAAPQPSGTAPSASSDPAVPSEPVTLRVWDQFTGDVQSSAIEKIYANFTTQYPHIAIERELMLTEQADEVSRTALGSGVGPDLLYLDVTPARTLIREGLLRSLDDYAAQYSWDQTFTADGLNWTTVDGQLWGLGGESEFVGLWYNQALFDDEGLAVPQTIEEAVAFCQDASARGYVPIAPWMERYGSVFMWLTNPLHNAVGVDYVEGLLFRNEGTWESPEIAAALKVLYEDLRAAGCFLEDTPAVTHDAARDLFASRDAFFMPAGTWNASFMDDLNGTDGFDIQMMPFFDMGTGQDRVFTLGMGSAWFVAANSQHPGEAALFLEHFFTDESVQILMEEASILPPVTTDSSGFNIPPMVAWVTEQLATQKMGYDIDVLAPEAWNVANFENAPAIWLGRMTVEEHLADLQRIWEEDYWGTSE